MKIIKTKKGDRILVDNEDFDYLNQMTWYVSSSSYAMTHRNNLLLSMQRILMKPSKSKCVDHINHNTLDNRKVNLRVCSLSQNHWNTLKHKTNKTGYKGVSLYKRNGKYEARIRIFGKKLWLGYFDLKKDAHEAYQKVSLVYHGKYALKSLKSQKGRRPLIQKLLT